MQEILIVCGNWAFYANRWYFVVDKLRGSIVLRANEKTSYNKFIAMVYEDYGLDRRLYNVELRYKLSKRCFQKIPGDTPPVCVANSRQLEGFLRQCKVDSLRLCVEVTEKKNSDEDCVHKASLVKEEYGDETDWKAEDEQRYKDGDWEGVDEDDLEEYRFRNCDDPDGASSGDEDFCRDGRVPEAEDEVDDVGGEENIAEQFERKDCPGNMGLKNPKPQSTPPNFEHPPQFESPLIKLEVGQCYATKAELEMKLKMYTVAHRCDYNVLKSTPTLLSVRCWLPGCTWYLRASTVGDCPSMRIKVFRRHHSCSVTERSSRAKQATPDILGHMYKDYAGGVGPKVMPNHVADCLNKRFGLKVEYWKARRALSYARELVMGTPESGYANLPAYLYRIRVANPGTYTRLEVDGEDRFKYLFISFGASIHGFLYMRKVIVVDGTFLTGKYKGTLLVATMQDGNYNIFPLAFAIVDTENDESWEWFFRQLNCLIPDDDRLAIISDRHSSIAKAIGKVYPLATRGICTYHLHKNILLRFKGREAYGLVKKAASAYRIGEFIDYYAQIEASKPDLHAYLQRADVKTWTRVHFPGNRYNITTSNIAESINKVLSAGRGYPPSAFLDTIRSLLTRWFSSRREKAGRMKTRLTTAVEKLLEPRVENAKLFTVTVVDADVSQVTWGSSIHVVNFKDKTCSCKRYDLDKIPCVHAIAAGEARKVSRISSTSSYYHTHFLASGYAKAIMPADPFLPLPIDVAGKVCLPPDTRQQPGRPKKIRIKCALEVAMAKKRQRKTYTCTRCGESGHNRLTCSNY